MKLAGHASLGVGRPIGAFMHHGMAWAGIHAGMYEVALGADRG